MKRCPIWLLIVCTVVNSLEAATALDYYRYFLANYSQYRNKPNDAHRWYKKLLQTKAPNYIYKGYLDLLFRNGELQHIVNLIPTLDQQFENDPDTQLIFAQALAQTGNIKAADECLIRTSTRHKTHQELVFLAAQSYMRRKEPENALTLINSLLDSTPRTPAHYVFYFLKSQIYTTLQQYDAAIENVKRSISINPSFEKGRLIHALLKEKKGNKADAIKAYEHFLANARSPLLKRQVQSHLDSLRNKNSRQDPLTPIQAQLARQHYESALKKVDASLEKQPNHTESRILKLKLLAAQQDYRSALTLLSQWIQEEPTLPTWYELLYQLSQKVGSQPALAVLLTQEKKDPHNPLVLIYLGALYNKVNEAEKSLNYLDKAYAKTNNKELKTKIAFQQALIYHDKKEYEPMLKRLVAGEQLGLNYPPLLNMLAYSYAKQNKHLDKANRLIQIALKTDGTNHYYLDTQALILSAQHEYDRAQVILEKLAQEHPRDTTILSHLSKVLLGQGAKEQAQQTLQAALKVAPLQEQQKFKLRLQEIGR